MLTIKENISLAPYTTFGVGGPARYFVDVATEGDLSEAIIFAKEHDLPFFILGKSSNTLIGDDGFSGMVIRLEIKGYENFFHDEYVDLRVGAGEVWDECVSMAVENGWSGIESLSGIPGSVGAAPVQNIGAYGRSIGDALSKVEVFDTKEKSIRIFSREECNLSYRASIFKTEKGKRYIITHVYLRLLQKSTAPIPPYHDLQNIFAGSEGIVPIADIRRAVLSARAEKGMTLLPGYETFKSAGSFFKNPVVSPNEFSGAESALIDHPDGVCTPPWYWKQIDGLVKISAACLIESAGFPKGYRDGSVGISPKHALAIINCGGATAADIAVLARKIQNTVYDKYGVVLEREVQYIGIAE